MNTMAIKNVFFVFIDHRVHREPWPSAGAAWSVFMG